MCIRDRFKGTGNSEIVLSRELADKRIFPAIDLTKSGTRKEELLLKKEELNVLWILRKALVGRMKPTEIMEFLTEKMTKTKTNKAFLESINDAD